MDIDNDDIGYPVKLYLPNGKGSAIVNSVDQMVNRKAKSVIVPCTFIKGSICLYCQRKGHWLRSCPNYLKDMREGRIKKFDSASGKSTI